MSWRVIASSSRISFGAYEDFEYLFIFLDCKGKFRLGLRWIIGEVIRMVGFYDDLVRNLWRNYVVVI
jgi:hypothetical protein